MSTAQCWHERVVYENVVYENVVKNNFAVNQRILTQTKKKKKKNLSCAIIKLKHNFYLDQT